MKKNVMMRLAAILLVCVLASTCGISGTYAKYVTTASGEDQARVAKWGVQVSVGGGLFDDSYVDVANGNVPGDTNLTVKSYNAEKVVAPGTKNNNSITFSITGTPEVKVDVKFDIKNDTKKDVFLAASTGKYLDWTTGNKADDKFDLADEYHPLVFTLKDGNDNVLVQGSLEAIDYYLENTLSGRYDANKELDTIIDGNNGTYTLSWEWFFEQADKDLYDKADTLLGNLAADATAFGTGLVAGTDYNLGVNLDFEITVTQVD